MKYLDTHHPVDSYPRTEGQVTDLLEAHGEEIVLTTTTIFVITNGFETETVIPPIQPLIS